jgi:hypothetical protein
VAFFQGEKMVGSTFSAPQEDSLKKSAFAEAKILQSDNPEQLLTLEVGGKPYLAIVRFFAGEFEASNNPAGFIVLSPLADAKKPVELAMTNILAMTAAVLLVGIILLLFFIHAFMKPVTVIEQGIGEILAGNKDYVFEVDDKNSFFANVLQGLNLVSAFLQGKPMPDDPDGHGDWGELMGDTGAGSAASAPGKVTGVAMPGMGGAPKAKPADDSDSDSEPDGTT